VCVFCVCTSARTRMCERATDDQLDCRLGKKKTYKPVVRYNRDYTTFIVALLLLFPLNQTYTCLLIYYIPTYYLYYIIFSQLGTIMAISLFRSLGKNHRKSRCLYTLTAAADTPDDHAPVGPVVIIIIFSYHSVFSVSFYATVRLKTKKKIKC